MITFDDHPAFFGKMTGKITRVLVLCFVAQASMAQHAELVSLEKLQTLIAAKEDPIQVINFWATWCAPCVKEIPLLEKLNQDRSDVGVTLVSMDYDLDPNPEKVYKFISRKNIRSKVVILNAGDPNSWISTIDKKWSGALPATLVVNSVTGKRKFWERELHEGDLEKLIEEVK
jgi:thiol-disulfide isomerase/thioredoxin